MEGLVKWFNTRKGFGFIKGDDGEDYFVHHSSIKQGTFLRDNDRVSFDTVQTEKGKQAQNVTLLQKGSEATGKDRKEENKHEEDEDIQDTEEF